MIGCSPLPFYAASNCNGQTTNDTAKRNKTLEFRDLRTILFVSLKTRYTRLVKSVQADTIITNYPLLQFIAILCFSLTFTTVLEQFPNRGVGAVFSSHIFFANRGNMTYTDTDFKKCSDRPRKPTFIQIFFGRLGFYVNNSLNLRSPFVPPYKNYNHFSWQNEPACCNIILTLVYSQ